MTPFFCVDISYVQTAGDPFLDAAHRFKDRDRRVIHAVPVGAHRLFELLWRCGGGCPASML